MSVLESSVLPSHTTGAERKKCGEADMSAHSPTPFRGMGSRTFRVTLLVYICEALSQSRVSSQVNAESTGRLALSEIAEPQWRGWTACRTPKLTCKYRRERIRLYEALTTARGMNIRRIFSTTRSDVVVLTCGVSMCSGGASCAYARNRAPTPERQLTSFLV